MSLLIKGVTALSGLAIDVAKNWAGLRIENLGAPDSGDDAKRHDSPPATHGAAQHTDRTRDKFIPANEGHIRAGTSTYKGLYAAVSGGADLDEPYVHFTRKVPSDFESFISMRAVWLCAAAAGNMYWRLGAYYAAGGELYTTHTDAPAFGVTATAGVNLINVQEPQNALTFANLALGDYIGIKFERQGANAADTLNDVLYFLGLLLTYTASQ